MAAKYNFTVPDAPKVKSVSDSLYELGTLMSGYQKTENDKKEADSRMAIEIAKMVSADKRYDADIVRQERDYARQLQQDKENTKRWEAGHQLALDAAGRQATEQTRLARAANQAFDIQEAKQNANRLAEDVFANYLTEAGTQASIDARDKLGVVGTNVGGTNIWEPVVVGKDANGKDLLGLRPEAQKAVNSLIKATDTSGERLDMALGSIDQDTAKNDLTSRLMKAANTDAATAAAAISPYTDKFVDKSSLLAAKDKNMEYYNKQIDNTVNAIQALGSGTRVNKNGQLVVTTGEGEDKEIIRAPEKAVPLSDVTERFNKTSNTGGTFLGLGFTDKEGVNFAQSFNDAKAALVKAGYSDSEVAGALTNSLADEYRAGRQGTGSWYEDPDSLKKMLARNIETNKAYDKAILESKQSPTSGQRTTLTEKLTDLNDKMRALQSAPLYTAKSEELLDRISKTLNTDVLGSDYKDHIQRLNSVK